MATSKTRQSFTLIFLLKFTYVSLQLGSVADEIAGDCLHIGFFLGLNNYFY